MSIDIIKNFSETLFLSLPLCTFLPHLNLPFLILSAFCLSLTLRLDSQIGCFSYFWPFGTWLSCRILSFSALTASVSPAVHRGPSNPCPLASVLTRLRPPFPSPKGEWKGETLFLSLRRSCEGLIPVPFFQLSASVGIPVKFLRVTTHPGFLAHPNFLGISEENILHSVLKIEKQALGKLMCEVAGSSDWWLSGVPSLVLLST